jgi:hypothetical protein
VLAGAGRWKVHAQKVKWDHSSAVVPIALMLLLLLSYIFICLPRSWLEDDGVALHWLVKLLLFLIQPIFIFCGREPNLGRSFILVSGAAR